MNKIPRLIKAIVAVNILFGLLAVGGLARGQTNTNTLGQDIQDVLKIFQPLATASNYAVAPYATYAPQTPKKWGGGVLVVYNVNNYVGAGLGVDYLGQFSLVSANVELKVDTHPFAFLGATNFTTTPFVIGGIGTPLGGTSTSPNAVVISDVGVNVSIGDIYKGWVLGTALAYGRWDNAGPYTGNRYHAALTLRKGF